MNVLDVFSGIGGFSLGLERAGMRTVAFCEIDPYCRAVLREHWPAIHVHRDIRCCHFPRGFADLICGGFPCQDISIAGKGAGIDGARSSLWSEYARIIGEVRPRYVIVENVAALLGRGIERVLGDLAALGFDAEWHCIPASAVGAPHRRDRVWVVGYSERSAQGRRRVQEHGKNSEAVGEWPTSQSIRASEDVADASKSRLPLAEQISLFREGWWQERGATSECGEVSDAASAGRNGAGTERPTAPNGSGSFREPSRSDWWLAEPDVGRVAHGVSLRVDRLRALGNAIVPQIAEIIGRAIMAQESMAGAVHE